MAQTASNIPLWSGDNNLLTSGILMSELYVNKINNVDFGSATAPTSNQVLTAISASNAQWITPTGTVSDAFTQTSVKTADYVANAGDEVLVDLSSASGNVTISMPASPVAGNQVRVVLISEHPTLNCLLSRNGNNWFGVTTAGIEDKYTLCLNGDNVTCRYFSSNVGWNVITDQIRPHFTQMLGSSTAMGAGASNAGIYNTCYYDIGSNVNFSGSNIKIRRSGIYSCEFQMYTETLAAGSAVKTYYTGTGTITTGSNLSYWQRSTLAAGGNTYGFGNKVMVNCSSGGYNQFYQLGATAATNSAFIGILTSTEIR
jgi:hypothetical protein